jgi:hypothetical protein
MILPAISWRRLVRLLLRIMRASMIEVHYRDSHRARKGCARQNRLAAPCAQECDHPLFDGGCC